jgi:hypothetical protein
MRSPSPDVSAQELRRENEELRRNLETAREEADALRNALAGSKGPVRQSGKTVVAGLGLVIAATLAATLVMYRQLGNHGAGANKPVPAAKTDH